MSHGRDVVGLYEEPTTYRHDYPIYPPQPRTKMIKGERTGGGDKTDLVEKTSPDPETTVSHDTLQQLSYIDKLPFNALWQPKEIIATHPRTPFCEGTTIIDEHLEEVIKTRPRREYVSPGVSLDNAEDPDTRRLMVNFTYTTTVGRANKEAWADFKPTTPCLPDTVFERIVDPLAIHLGLVPDMPAGCQSAGRKWDGLQERSMVDTTRHFWTNRPPYVGYEKRLVELVTPEEKRTVRDLIDANLLRLPYVRMPLSYSGYRPQLANNVPLERKRFPVVSPELTVSQAITECE